MSREAQVTVNYGGKGLRWVTTVERMIALEHAYGLPKLRTPDGEESIAQFSFRVLQTDILTLLYEPMTAADLTRIVTLFSVELGEHILVPCQRD